MPAGHASGGWDMIGIHDFYGWFCHQLPQRSPHPGGQPFPLCYRCAGIHLGFFVSFLYLALSGGWRRRLPDMRPLISLGVMLAPLTVDGWGNLLGVWNTPGWLRALTGLAAGVALPLLVLPFARRPGAGEPSRASLPDGRSVLGPVTSGGALLFLLMRSDQPMVAQALAFGALVGTLLFVSSLLRAVVWNVGVPLARKAGSP